nr:MAG TPA: crystallin beta/gamma motif-containing protein [Caudoviricetes sp.]
MTEEQRNAIRQRLEGMNGNIQPEYQPREPEENDKGILDTMIDGVKDAAEWVADSAVGQFVKNAATEAYEDTRDVLMAKSWDEAHEAYNRHDLTANINAVANDNNSFFQPVAQAIQQSSTAADYFFSETGKLSQARTVEQELGIPVAVTMADSESWKKANAMYQENLEYKKLAEENGQQWSIDDFYSRYPAVKEIAEADPAAGALILKDAPKVRRELDIIDGFSQYLSMGNKQLELNNLRFKSHGGDLSENDKQRMQDLEKQLDIEQKLYDVKFRDNPILYALSTVGQSLPEMGQSIYAGMEDAGAWWAAGTWAGAGVGSALGPGGAAAGAVAGGTAGGIIGTVKGVAKAVATSEARREVLRQVAMESAAKATAPQLLKAGMQFGAFRGMAAPEIGDRYDEYKNLRDSKGNPLLSDDEAWSNAILGGSANAALEVMPTFGVLGKLAAPGKQSARVFEDIIAGHTAKTQLASHMGDSFKKFMGGTLKVGATESFEEATQQISDDIIMNNIKNANGGRAYSEKYGVLYDEGKALTAKEILGNAIDAAVAAIPSSLIFGMAGSIGSGAASTGRYAARQRHLSQIEANNGAMARHTYTGTIMAQELQEAVHDSDLQQTAPDVQKKLIHDKAAGTGFEVMYIDTEMAMQKENGKEDLAQVAKAAGIDEEALQTAVETKGTLAVPLESFAQSDASSEILDAASFNVEADSMARMRENAKHTLETMKANAEKLVEQQINLVKTIPQELYPEETPEAQVYRDLVEAAIVTDMENPARGLKQLIQQAEAEKLAILQPALNFLNDTHGQGVSIIDTGDGRGIRVSENAKWYQDFYREHKRKPTKQELMDIASDMVSGKSNIEYFTVTDEHMAAEADKVSADLSAVNDRLEALNSVKDKVQQINSTEMKIAESMSPEAYKVYRNYMTMLGNAPGTASRAARVNAVLLAHMAERLAENTRRATGKQEYTAVDAAKKIELQLGGAYNSGNTMNQAMFDVSKRGVSSLNGFADKLAVLVKQGTEASKVMWIDKSVNVIYPGAQLNHAITKHSLTEDDLANIQSGINTLTDVYTSQQKVGIFMGQPVFGKTAVNGIEYYICLEFSPNGDVYFLTASKTNDKMYDEYKKEHGSERLCSQSEPVPHSNHALSIPNIQELLGIVKNENTLNQMAGENAKTAALDKLEQAKAMVEDRGSEDIYKATGWFKGYDGKWRFEIPDNLEAISLDKLLKNKYADLGEIYDNPQLFEAYPKLKNVMIFIEELGGRTAGFASAINNTITLSASLKNDDEIKSTLVHEIQHLIQGREGFARGGSSQNARAQIRGEIEVLDGQRARFSEDEKAYLAYQDMWMNAALVESDGEKADRAAAEIEKLKKRISKERQVEILGLDGRHKALIKALTEGGDDLNLYWRLAGEQEARYVQSRAALNNQGNKEAADMPSPHDVDAIVVFGNMAIPANATVETSAQNTLHGDEQEVQRQIRAKEELLNSEPVVEITENILAGKDKAELKKYFREMYQHTEAGAKYPQSTVVYTKYGEPVCITVNGTYKEMVRHSADKRIIMLMPYLKQILENSTLMFSEKPLTGRIKKLNSVTNGYSHYACKVSIDGENVLVRAVIRRSTNGDYCYDINIDNYQQEKKDPSQPGWPDHNSGAVMKNPSKSASIISDWIEKVNSHNLSILSGNGESVKQNETFNQMAWHGSPYNFDSFDLGAVGNGSGANMHGWGLYFAGNKKEIKAYRKLLGEKGFGYKVDIPESDSMMDENTVFKKMPSKIQQAVTIVYNSFSDEQKRIFAEKILGNLSTSKDEVALNQSILDYKACVRFFDVAINKTKIPAFRLRASKRSMLRVGYTEEQIERIISNVDYAQAEKAQFEASHAKDIDSKQNKLELMKQEREIENAKALKNVMSVLAESNSVRFVGSQIYNALTAALDNDIKNTSLALKNAGVEGISYKGEEGKCYVVFDDKAVSIIEKFNQEIKGQTGTTANGQYIVSLFEKADESTFMHEMAHVYLLELEKLAELDDQCRADLETIMEWANYHEGDEKKFKGSPFAKEFRQMANNMLAAEQAGDYDTVNKIRRQWAHERFARGFEMYLQHGTAPSRGLQSVFRRFKQFLSAIYIAFTGEGVRANAKVERVMARMLASDEEIEAMTLDDRYKDIAKAGGEKLLNETQQETYARWYQEAKEEAKEKLMKVMMKDLDEEHQRKYQEALEHEREETRKNLEALPLYIAQKVAKETGNDNAVVEIGLYPTVEAYHAELAEYGSLKDTLENYMKEFAEEMDKKILQEHVSEEQLSKMMEQTVYHKKLMAFEAEALREKEKAANKINAKAKEAMDQVSAAVNNLPDDIDITAEKDNKEVKKLLQAINKLRFSTRWTAKELGDIEGLAKQATKADVEKALKEFSKEATAWKRNLKTLEEAFKGRMQIIKKTTRSMLHNQPISESCDYGRYVASEKRAAEMMHKMVRAGRWDVAMIQQEARFTSAALAEAAEKNREKVNKILAKVAKQLTAKSVRIPVEHRYWIKKIAFDMKLDKNWQKDIGRPTSENGRIVRKEPVRPEDCRQLAEIFAELKNSLDVQEDMLGALDVIYQPGFTDYRALTAKQFEACIDIISVLYKTGKNKFQLKSFDGKLISDVLNDIRLDISEQGDVINLPHVIQNKVNDNIGGLGYNDYFAKIPGIGPTLSQYGSKYLVAHMKPEEIIRLLGPVAHKYLYGLYDRAAGENGRRTAEATQKLQEIMSVYSRKEKQNFSKQQYKLRIGKKEETFSKENIICMALNMGNDVNFIRLYKGLDVMGNVLQGFVERNMTKKDWEVVQAIWDLIGSYWPETVKVEEELNGVTLEGVKPTPFTVMCDGQPIKMRGGYYPIAYNPMKSPKAEQQAMDAVTQTNMSGAQVLGTGRGFTKSRSDTQNIERPLLLQFNVIPTHLQNVIQNITFRIAARDAYRLTHAQGFEDLVRGTLGDDALRAIDQWVVDCWRTMPTDNDLGSSIFSSAIGFLRRNAAINIMGWRWWPVIENVTNIFPMMDRIGAAETVTAIGDYMKHRKENDKLLLKSIFMTNRINSMDRDIGAMPGIFKAGYATTDWLKEHAYTALAFTDLMFSKPLWCKAYKDNFASRYQEVLREEKEAKEDLEAAQEAVKEYRIQISESNKEIYILQQRLTEGSPYEQEAGPGTVQEINDIRKRIAELQIELEPLKKSLFKATCEVERLSERPFKSQSDIIKEAEYRAIQDADAVVRNVFGSGQTKDLASVQKGGEFLKLFTAFYSFFSTQMNAILAAYYKGKFAKQDIAGGQNYKRWMPFAKAVFYRIVLTSAMATLLKMVILGDGSDDDHKYGKVKDGDGNDIKEEIPLIERFFVQLAKNTVSTASGSFVGLRDIVNLYNNLVFEGTDFGRGASIGSISVGVIDKLTKTFKLVTQQEEKNARIDEQEAKRQAKYDKMTPEAKKKFDEKRQYMKPAHRITWADIAKGVAQTVTAVSAAKTGITDTMANAVTTTLQYMADGDGRYDKSLSNIVWSAIWNKKPVEREIPQKPVKPKKKKKGADKK